MKQAITIILGIILFGYAVKAQNPVRVTKGTPLIFGKEENSMIVIRNNAKVVAMYGFNNGKWTVIDSMAVIESLYKQNEAQFKLSLDYAERLSELQKRYDWLVDQYNARLKADTELVNGLKKAFGLKK